MVIWKVLELMRRRRRRWCKNGWDIRRYLELDEVIIISKLMKQEGQMKERKKERGKLSGWKLGDDKYKCWNKDRINTIVGYIFR